MIPFIQNIKEVYYELKNDLKIINTNYFKVSIFVVLIQMIYEFQKSIYLTNLANIGRCLCIVIFDFWFFMFLYIFWVSFIDKVTFTKNYNNEISYDNIKKLYERIESELKEKRVEVIFELSFISFILSVLGYMVF